MAEKTRALGNRSFVVNMKRETKMHIRKPTKNGIAVRTLSTLGTAHHKPTRYILAAAVAAIVSPGHASAQEIANTAFAACSSQAYMTQGWWRPSTFELNLATGDYSVAAKEHSIRKGNETGGIHEQPLSALGFNMRDRYVYGWSDQFGQPVRVHNDWSVEPLDGVNITRENFSVGDVSTDGNKYYVYRSGRRNGLFSIGLDPDASDYLQMQRVVDGNTLNLQISDFAFNPLDSMIYAVDQGGILMQIDPNTGNNRVLASTGISGRGSFGAAFFDAEGRFYFGRNNDGDIFRVNIPSGEYTAEFFASGPSSTANDGFRCASAPLTSIAASEKDYGDAPASYGTYLADDGARHELSNPEVRLGATVDSESDAYAYPLSDDDSGADEVTSDYVSQGFRHAGFFSTDQMNAQLQIFNPESEAGIESWEIRIEGANYDMTSFTPMGATAGEIQKSSGVGNTYDYVIPMTGAIPGFNGNVQIAIVGTRHPQSTDTTASVTNVATGVPTSTGLSGDEDGVQFVTNLVESQQAIAMVDANSSGYLNAWIDTDQNGSFDAHEQLVTDKLMDGGKQAVYMTIPANVAAGDTWARFRISSAPGLQAVGESADGEVEDYQVSLEKETLTVTSYPSNTEWTTIAFEDNWPLVGDYDMNDLVARLRTHTYENSSGITKVVIEGTLVAVGAEYENGFAIRLPGVARDAVDEANIRFGISNSDQVTNPLEPGRKEAILVVTENMFNHVRPSDSCDFYRTEPGCGADPEFSFKMSVPFTTPQEVKLSGAYDPFLFATPGAFHGAHFVTPPGRGYEIHMKNQSPTEAFDSTLFAGAGHDGSDPAAGYYFQTANGMPWAIEIGAEWDYPIEFIEVSAAYPQFSEFATSDGQQANDWYTPENAVDNLLFSE